jgi:hypothetical protein
MAGTKDRVASAAGSARPYVDRAFRDEELRDNLRAAFSAARDVYNELAPPKGVSGVAARLASDEDIQQNLRTAVAELRLAGERLQGQRAPSHTGRNIALVLLGIAIGLFFNPYTGPETRRWVRDRFSNNGRDDLAYPDVSHNAEPAL